MFENDRIKGIIFDCYGTLINVNTDENSFETYDMVSKWLQYHGVKISPDDLKEGYFNKVKAVMEGSGEEYPEIKIEEIFADICGENSIWEISAGELGIEASRVFRSASLRRLEVFQESIDIIENNPDIRMCIVSNGQRVFSEQELRFLELSDYFDFVIFSSDHGYKKPDSRLFEHALKRLEFEPREVLSLGDTPENDIVPPQELGMKAMHISDAWKMLP